MENKSPFQYGWIVVGFSFITLGLVYGAWYSFSVFFVALLNEFGRTRAVGAGAFSFFVIISSVTSSFAGGMVDRVGPKRVIAIGSLILGLGLALCSLTQTWWHFYVSFSAVTAVGLGSSGWVSNLAVIQHRFKEKKGLAIGIISSGIGIGILVYVPLAQYLILLFGWRWAYRIMAISIPMIVISLAMAILKKTSRPLPSYPTELEIIPTVDKDPLVVDKEWALQSWMLERAVTTKPFWLLGLAFFGGNFVTHSIFTHQVAFFVVDRGFDPLFASYIVGLIGIVSIGGKILWGGLSDIIGREITYTMGIASSIFGLIILIFLNFFPTSHLLYLYAFFFGMGYSVTAALPPLVTTDIFGVEAFGKIFGSMMIFIGGGVASGAWFAGLIHDHLQSYLPVFIILIFLALFSSLNLWWAAPRKIRRVPGKAKSVVD
jgi:MFS family permease